MYKYLFLKLKQKKMHNTQSLSYKSVKYTIVFTFFNNLLRFQYQIHAMVLYIFYYVNN